MNDQQLDTSSPATQLQLLNTVLNSFTLASPTPTFPTCRDAQLRQIQTFITRKRVNATPTATAPQKHNNTNAVLLVLGRPGTGKTHTVHYALKDQQFLPLLHTSDTFFTQILKFYLPPQRHLRGLANLNKITSGGAIDQRDNYQTQLFEFLNKQRRVKLKAQPLVFLLDEADLHLQSSNSRNTNLNSLTLLVEYVIKSDNMCLILITNSASLKTTALRRYQKSIETCEFPSYTFQDFANIIQQTTNNDENNNVTSQFVRLPAVQLLFRKVASQGCGDFRKFLEAIRRLHHAMALSDPTKSAPKSRQTSPTENNEDVQTPAFGNTSRVRHMNLPSRSEAETSRLPSRRRRHLDMTTTDLVSTEKRSLSSSSSSSGSYKKKAKRIDDHAKHVIGDDDDDENDDGHFVISGIVEVVATTGQYASCPYIMGLVEAVEQLSLHSKLLFCSIGRLHAQQSTIEYLPLVDVMAMYSDLCALKLQPILLKGERLMGAINECQSLDLIMASQTSQTSEGTSSSRGRQLQRSLSAHRATTPSKKKTPGRSPRQMLSATPPSTRSGAGRPPCQCEENLSVKLAMDSVDTLVALMDELGVRKSMPLGLAACVAVVLDS